MHPDALMATRPEKEPRRERKEEVFMKKNISSVGNLHTHGQ